MEQQAEETPIEYLARTAREVGRMSERNRVLEIILTYSRAGWLPNDVTVLMCKDILDKENDK